MKRKISVIASHASSLDDVVRVELAKFGCDDCGHETVTVAGTSPFCIHCSSENTHEVEVVESNLYDTPEEELSSVTCPHCQTANILPDVELASLEGKMGCVTCGTELSLFVAETVAESEEETKDDEMESKDEMDDDKSEEESTAGEESDDDKSDDEKPEDNEMSEDEPDEDSEEEASVETEEAATEEETAGGYGKDMDESEMEEDEDEDEVASLEAEFSEEASTEIPEVTEAKILDIVMASIEDDATASVDFVPHGDMILALVDKVHVATLTKTEETANADIFGSDEYMQALASTFESAGLEGVIEQYNFVQSSINVSGEALAKYGEERAKLEVEANVEQVLADFKADLRQSVEIAASGLTRNFFVDHAHVVKERLVKDLTAAGVRNAQVLVDTAYAETEDQHNSTIFAIASDLVGRSRDSRNDLSDAVARVRAPIAESEDTASTVEQQLETPLVIQQPQVATASLVTKGEKTTSRVRALASKSRFTSR
ncbi:hypothetical protein GR7B_00129 [Vibrio phage vB_VcorM_GR7B]|nr:hypothetical protein GR7B_00129 [Vibrio phage vB_VcorM_GR7B]